jgi:opacity protein-like surface antigen
MKRFIAAAALAAAAIAPATASAVPPGNSGAPVGSQNACTTAGTPAPGVSPSCNFMGAGAGIGYGGVSQSGFKLSHVQKINVCGPDPADATKSIVTGVTGSVRIDDEGSWAPGPTAYFAQGPSESFLSGVVFTLTIKGVGFGAVGGQGTPGPNSGSEPATPSAANNWAGSENNTGGLKVGDPC